MKKVLLLTVLVFCLGAKGQTGIINTICGNGAGANSYTCCYAGDGGQATGAEINDATGLIFDNAGNMYIADGANNRVRKINTSGIITTIAGNGISSYSGNGGQATAAELRSPGAIAFDEIGNLYIAEYGNNRIRMVNTNGIISLIAGNGTVGYAGDGGQATAAELHNPWGLAFDTLGNLYIGDYGNNLVRMINTGGVISTFAGNYISGSGYTGDGGQATAATLDQPSGLVFDATGNLYIADAHNGSIRMVNTLGINFNYSW